MAYSRKLKSPDGIEYEARSPAEANNLVFGAGYTDAAEQEEPMSAPTPEPQPQRSSPRSSARSSRPEQRGAEHNADKESAAQ